MKPEIEAKFLDINIDDMRSRLQRAGAECVHAMRLMRRVVFDYANQTGKKIDGWVRVRDEGDKVTLTYKTVEEKTFGGATEIEVTVSDYEKTVAIFGSIMPLKESYQESRRETWLLDGVEIVIDEWPWLKPFIEIEASNEGDVKRVAKILGFHWSDAVFGSVTTAYRLQYPDITANDHISSIPEITFSKPRPAWFVKD